MNPQTTLPTGTNGESTLHELFTLSDEQILEIEPEPELGAQANRPNSSVLTQHAAPLQQRNASGTNHGATQVSNAWPDANHQPPSTSHESPATNHESAEPPPWLAAQMKDPWSGAEVQEFWNGVQQAKTEAAACQAYRAAIATPEDARALKELYPGGLAEARAAADRARLLEEIDRAYFGAASAAPEQISATRAQLAQRMLREDPAAFREMVIAGLHALEEAEKGSGASASSNLPRLAKLFAEQSPGDVNVAPSFRAASSTEAQPASTSPVGAQHAAPQLGNASASNAHVAAYAAFERAANEDLERTVGSAIERTLEQALPGISKRADAATAGARHAVPVHQRLATAIRQDIEHALQGDRQLGEQVAQLLASRRFDNDTRAQVVRLINERAQQLVPAAAKRVLNDWTQTTLAAHRSRAQREDSAAHRVDLAAAEAASLYAEPRSASSPAEARARTSRPVILSEAKNLSSRAPHRGVDYRKLSDEQILDLS